MSASDVAAVATLDEPTRRRIYDHVRALAVPASRDEVARALGVTRRTAAFHLDRLAEQGLLAVTFARRSGRSGPGAGRPAKLYQRSAREVSVSLPPRHYGLAGSLLAGAFVEAQESGEAPRAVLDRRARDLGRALVNDSRALASDSRALVSDNREDENHEDNKADGAPASRQGALMSLLAEHGYEPQVEGRDIVLRNCPFHVMAKEHAELVCGMNLHLLQGVLEGLGATSVRARLDPQPSRCCVRLVQ